jgi:uncharacterized protein with HEPN domain
MRRDLRVYLKDIQMCIADIELFTAGMTAESYESNILVRRAVEREFTIIAEAISHISAMSPELHVRIENVRGIANFRNVLIHDYPEVDDRYVWKIIVAFVPLLK